VCDLYSTRLRIIFITNRIIITISNERASMPVTVIWAWHGGAPLNDLPFDSGPSHASPKQELFFFSDIESMLVNTSEEENASATMRSSVPILYD